MNEPGNTNVPSGFRQRTKHFGAAQLAGANVDDRLIVRNKLTGLECACDLGDRIACGAPVRNQYNKSGKSSQ